MKTLIIYGKDYNIKQEIWNKHILMHPVRSEDALLNNIRIVFGQKYFTSKSIEEMIEDEYKIHTSFREMLEKANDLYEYE